MSAAALTFLGTSGEGAPNFIALFSLFTITLVMTPFVVGASRLLYGFLARRRFLAQRSPLSGQPVELSEQSWLELGASLLDDA
jgi:hypothetical protein